MCKKKPLIIKYTIAEGERLDQFLGSSNADNTRSYYNKKIKKGEIVVNEKTVKSGYILQQGDIISITPDEEDRSMEAADIPLDIIFEDEALLVVNKPTGLTVHPGKGTTNDTLVNALLNYTDKLSMIGHTDRPGIVHRLDKFTSGLLVVTKTDTAYHALRKQFENKEIHRIYNALVWGSFVDEGSTTIETFINRSRRDPTKMAVSKTGKEAITHYKVLQDFSYFSFLEVWLETGRTHQIRVHMNHIHHPVVGDPDYKGRDSQLKRLPVELKRRGIHLLKLLQHQALHAKKLSFIHPLSKEKVSFESPLPDNMQTALEKLKMMFLLDVE
jgi:23S rRNA pseudouridine1911/1915/1917 synthase